LSELHDMFKRATGCRALLEAQSVCQTVICFDVKGQPPWHSKICI